MDGMNKEMDNMPQRTPERSRLRDFGAFQIDISKFATREIAAIGNEASTHIPPLLSDAFSEQHVAKEADTHALSKKIADSGDVSPSKQKQPKFGRVIKLTPITVSVSRIEKALYHPPDDTESSASAPQKVRKKKWFVLGMRLLFTLLLFAFLFKSLSWPALIRAFEHIHRSIALVSVVVGAGGVVLSAYQWRSLLHGEKILYDLAELIDLYMVGIAFNHFLPTGMGGDAVKALYVGRASGNSAGSASAVLMCRIIGFFSMLFVAFPVLFFWHEHLNTMLMEWFGLLSLIVGSLIGGGVAIVGLLPRLFKGKWSNVRIFASAIRVENALFAAAKRPRSIGIAIIYGIVFWIAAILNSYVYADALRIHASVYFFCIAVPLISLVSFLPISINGYGLRESAYVYAFSTIHVSATNALLLALLLDTQVLFFGVIGGCIYFTKSSKSNKVKMRKVA